MSSTIQSFWSSTPQHFVFPTPQPLADRSNIPGYQNSSEILIQRCEAVASQLEKQKQENDTLKNKLECAENDRGLTEINLRNLESFQRLRISELEDRLAAKQAEQQQTQSEMNSVKARLHDLSSTLGALQTDLRETRSWCKDQRSTFETLQTSTSSKVSQLENDLSAKQTELDNTKARLQALQIALQETQSRFKDQRTILRHLQASRISLLWNSLVAKQTELKEANDIIAKCNVSLINNSQNYCTKQLPASTRTKRKGFPIPGIIHRVPDRELKQDH